MRPRFNIFKNWNKVCYIRGRIDAAKLYPEESSFPSKTKSPNDRDDIYVDEYGNETMNYGEPVKYYINYQPVTNDAEEAFLKSYGITSSGTVRALVDYKYLDGFHHYDLAYLYGATPSEEEYAGQYANYRVITSVPQNMKVLVYFERLTKQ
jgi:hypothetical protein